MGGIRSRMQKSVSTELGDCRVEEDWDCIRLFLPEVDGKGAHIEFGKRAPFYYKCLANSSPHSRKCPCLLQRRPFDLHQKSMDPNMEARRLLKAKGWFGLFNAQLKERSGGETVVIEEDNQQISFHFRLYKERHSRISFNIRNDEQVGCESKPYRGCKDNPRISYTTFRSFAFDIQNNIFSPAIVK